MAYSWISGVARPGAGLYPTSAGVVVLMLMRCGIVPWALGPTGAVQRNEWRGADTGSCGGFRGVH